MVKTSLEHMSDVLNLNTKLFDYFLTIIRTKHVGCSLSAQNEIYDIGTKIIYFQSFVTTDMFLFCKPICFSWNCRMFKDLAFGNIKIRFKAILKKLELSAQIDFSPQIYLFHELLLPEGDFSAQIYFFHELLPPEGD